MCQPPQSIRSWSLLGVTKPLAFEQCRTGSLDSTPETSLLKTSLALGDQLRQHALPMSTGFKCLSTTILTSFLLCLKLRLASAVAHYKGSFTTACELEKSLCVGCPISWLRPKSKSVSQLVAIIWPCSTKESGVCMMFSQVVVLA